MTLTGATSGTLPEIYAGALAGRSAGTISGVDVYGTVKGDQPSATGKGKNPNVGGLVGRMEGGAIHTSSFTGSVTAEQNDPDDDGTANAGGLVGYKNSGDIWTSFTRGSVKATMSASGNDDGIANAGGLVGYNMAGDIHTAYSLADVNAEANNAVGGSSSSYLRAGFLAGYWAAGTITNSYGAGRPTVTQPSGGNASDRREGLAGHMNASTGANSWFDTTVSGIPDPGFDFNGRGRTTTPLQTPTGYTGDYANWNANVDGVTGNDDPWDFGTSSQYPVFKYGRTAASQRPGGHAEHIADIHLRDHQGQQHRRLRRKPRRLRYPHRHAQRGAAGARHRHVHARKPNRVQPERRDRHHRGRLNHRYGDGHGGQQLHGRVGRERDHRRDDWADLDRRARRRVTHHQGRRPADQAHGRQAVRGRHEDTGGLDGCDQRHRLQGAVEQHLQHVLDKPVRGHGVERQHDHLHHQPHPCPDGPALGTTCG